MAKKRKDTSVDLVDSKEEGVRNVLEEQPETKIPSKEDPIVGESHGSALRDPTVRRVVTPIANAFQAPQEEENVEVMVGQVPCVSPKAKGIGIEA